jgi:hypothetical protein
MLPEKELSRRRRIRIHDEQKEGDRVWDEIFIYDCIRVPMDLFIFLKIAILLIVAVSLLIMFQGLERKILR